MNRWASLLGALVCVAVLAGALAVEATSRESDSAFGNPAMGAGAFVLDARAARFDVQRLVSTPAQLTADPTVEASRSLLVIVGTQAGYSAQDAAAVRAFLEAGGQVLVADAFGNANTLTTPLGVTFERVRLVEPQGPTVAAQWGDQSFTLALQGPTALRLDPAAQATVLASSSAASFLDRDGDGLITTGDPHGPFPISAMASVGTRGGRVVALADPAPLKAGAPGAATGDNRLWRQAVLGGLLPNGGQVFVDESRTPVGDPLLRGLAAVAAAASTPAWRLGLAGLGALLAVGLFLPAHADEWRAHRFRPHHFVRRAALRALLVQAKTAAAKATRASTWTRRGTAALLGGSALALLGLAFASRQASYAGALLLAAGAAASWTGPPRIGLQRRVGAVRVAEETPVRVELALWSATLRPASVEARDPIPQEFRVEAGEPWFQTTLGRDPIALGYSVVPSLRGPYRIGPLAVRRTDPLGLRRQETEVDLGAGLDVEPRKEPINRIPFKTRVPRVTLGPHLVNRAGDGSEFHSLRGYQQGDSFRSINWKASARSKDLVVSQRVHESRTTLTLFLDARALSGAGPAAKAPLAHGCRVTLGLASGALQVRDRVRVVVYGDGIQVSAPGVGTRQIHELAQTLSHLAASGTTTLQDAIEEVLPDLQPGTPAILVSGLEGDATIVPALRDLRARGLLVTAIVSPIGLEPVAPAWGDEAEDPEPEAAQVKADLAATLKELRASGITVFEALEGVPLDYQFRVGVLA